MAQQDVIRYAIAAGVAAGLWALGWLLARFVLAWLAHLVHRTRTDLDELVLAALRPQVPVWFLILGVVIALRVAGLDAGVRARVDRLAGVALILSATFAVAGFLGRLVAARAAAIAGAVPATTLTQNAVRIGVVLLGVMVALGNLGVAITPVLTALGVGSLAVALALQPTLANLFAGFHISLARHVRVGDYVELEGGQAGFVEDISWRATLIRELPNNLVVVPNAKLSEIIVRNFTLPDPEMSVVVPCGVSYGSDLAQVERVVVEEAREVQRTVEGAIATHEPFVRFHTFGDSSIDFSVILRVNVIGARFLAQSVLIQRLHRRFAAEGIEIPFPQRVVHPAPPASDA